MTSFEPRPPLQRILQVAANGELLARYGKRGLSAGKQMFETKVLFVLASSPVRGR
jgi:hypothetical protein